MDRYTSQKCLALEEAIDAFGIPSHVEVEGGMLKIIILGTAPVSQDQGGGGTRISTPIPDWVTVD